MPFTEIAVPHKIKFHCCMSMMHVQNRDLRIEYHSNMVNSHGTGDEHHQGKLIKCYLFKFVHKITEVERYTECIFFQLFFHKF